MNTDDLNANEGHVSDKAKAERYDFIRQISYLDFVKDESLGKIVREFIKGLDKGGYNNGKQSSNNWL